MTANNLFHNIPSLLPKELFERIVETDHLRVERIVSDGHNSPADFWYDQPQNEWILLLQGQAELLFEGETQPRRLTPGDYLNIPAHQKHRVESTSTDIKTIWLAIFY